MMGVFSLVWTVAGTHVLKAARGVFPSFPGFTLVSKPGDSDTCTGKWETFVMYFISLLL